MPAAVAVLAAAALGVIRDPWEPEVFYHPSQKCILAFHTQLSAKQSLYAVCDHYVGGSPTFRLRGSKVEECPSYCYQKEAHTVAVGTPWLVSEWQDDGTCNCYGAATNADFDVLVGRSGKEVRRATGGACSTVTHWVPLSCMWAGAQACKDAPGPPNGCMYTTQGCCVDAAGYNWHDGMWPPPWWVMLAICVFLLCSPLTGCLPVIVRPAQNTGTDTTADAEQGARGGGGASSVMSAQALEARRARCTALAASLAFTATADRDDECCICLDAMLADTTLCVLECGHCLHQDCFADYVKHAALKSSPAPKCPVCRAPLLDDIDGEKAPEAGAAAAAAVGQGAVETTQRSPRLLGPSLDTDLVEIRVDDGLGGGGSGSARTFDFRRALGGIAPPSPTYSDAEEDNDGDASGGGVHVDALPPRSPLRRSGTGNPLSGGDTAAGAASVSPRAAAAARERLAADAELLALEFLITLPIILSAGRGAGARGVGSAGLSHYVSDTPVVADVD